MLALKFLTADGKGPQTKFEWPLPRKTKRGRWHPGRWVTVSGELEVCKRGIHACLPDQARQWMNDRLFVIELQEVVEQRDKLLARRGRLLREVEEWSLSVWSKKGWSTQRVEDVRRACRRSDESIRRDALGWFETLELRPMVTPLATSALCAQVLAALPSVDLDAVLREAA
jgi:hypothetical protein